MEIDRRLRLEATKNLRQIDNVRAGLQWIKHNPKGFRIRANEFEETLKEMNQEVFGPRYSALDTDWYGHVAEVKNLFQDADSELPSIAHFMDLYDDSKVEQTESGEFLTDYFLTYRRLIESGEWGFATSIIDDPNRLASGLLIEGYGRLIEDYYQIPGLAREFVLGFEEILYEHHTNSALLRDVLPWMVEEKGSFSPLVERGLKDEALDQNSELLMAASKLNRVLRRGGWIADQRFIGGINGKVINEYGLINEIQKFPRPIVVDFNGVIASLSFPLELNPQAPEFLAELRKIGNVFIVTGSSGGRRGNSAWEFIHDFLIQNKVWTPEMVLITADNYIPLTTEIGNGYDLLSDLRTSYLQLLRGQGILCTSEDLRGRLFEKRVALIFGKPFLVPIIDDYGAAVTGNPGMLGIHVRQYTAASYEDQSGKLKEEEMGTYSLMDATQIVKDHYSNS